MENIKLATTDEDIQACFTVLVQLRPHLKADEFLSTVRAMQTEGYCLAYIEEDNKVAAVAGYRIARNLFMGKHLYVDDLVTAEQQRSKGYGEQLIQWLREQALANNCNYFHLDSGTHRGSAHRFYFKQGLTIASYHFSEKLN